MRNLVWWRGKRIEETGQFSGILNGYEGVKEAVKSLYKDGWEWYSEVEGKTLRGWETGFNRETERRFKRKKIFFKGFESGFQNILWNEEIRWKEKDNWIRRMTKK